MHLTSLPVKRIFKFLLVLSIFQNSFIAANGQWQWLNPKPSGYTCSKIIFTDSLKGFILNTNGDLVTTADQGGSWNFQQSFPANSMMDMKDSTGIICGYGIVYVSKDNGKSWQMKTTGISDYFRMADVVSRDTIFLANENGKIYRSDDGGTNWKTFTCGIQISSIEFINSKIGYAGGKSSSILKTEDGGATWQQNVTVNTFPSNTTAIKFIDINTGFAFREHSDLLSTTDAGKTWKEYDLGDGIYSFYFISKTVGFACGEHGVTYRTDDGGLTWKWISLTGRIDAYHLYSIYFLNSNVGFTVGTRGRILKTIDGGTTWNIYSPTYIDVGTISVPSKNTAYAAAGNTLYKTADNGRTWKQLPLTVGTSYAEYDVFQTCHFFNADTGFVSASDPARTYKTYDGGLNWKSISPTQYGYDDVTDIQFIDKNTGFLAINIFYGGTIVKTKDGGETWSQVWSSQYYGEIFQKIHFTDEKTGYASRYNRLFKTEDSAKTWTELWQAEAISAIWFITQQTGFVAGENGMLKRTNDGGKTWTNIAIANQYYDDIYTIKFLNEQVGYLSAENGSLYKTIDGGNTWKQNGKESYHTIRTIQFAPDSSVYIAGQFGSILRSDVREYHIDSFKINTAANCNIEFSSVVTAVFSYMDSIKFEFGVNSFDREIAASPSAISSKQQKVTATVAGLPPSTEFKVRLKAYYNGQYNYGNEYTFRTSDIPLTPGISSQGKSAFCFGDSITLTSTATSGNQWFFNGTTITGETNQTYTARLPGKYQLVRTLNCYTSDTASIIINTIPAVVPSVTISYTGCPSDTLRFIASSLNGGANPQYQWFVNNAASGTGPSFTLNNAANNAEIHCRLISNAECAIPQSTDDSVVINCIITAVPDIDGLEELHVSPNPTPDQLNIYMKLSHAKKVSYELFNITGTKLYEKRLVRITGSTTQQIDLSNLSRGVYFLKINIDKQIVIRKVIKMN